MLTIHVPGSNNIPAVHNHAGLCPFVHHAKTLSTEPGDWQALVQDELM